MVAAKPVHLLKSSRIHPEVFRQFNGYRSVKHNTVQCLLLYIRQHVSTSYGSSSGLILRKHRSLYSYFHKMQWDPDCLQS